MAHSIVGPAFPNPEHCSLKPYRTRRRLYSDGRHAELLDLPEQFNEALAAWLAAPAPPPAAEAPRAALRWRHQLRMQRYEEAAETLLQAAAEPMVRPLCRYTLGYRALMMLCAPNILRHESIRFERQHAPRHTLILLSQVLDGMHPLYPSAMGSKLLTML